MSVGQYLAGLALVGLVTAAAVVAAVRVRRRVLPAAAGAPARLAEAVIGLATTIVVLEALGTVGLLRPVPIALASIAVVLAAARIAPVAPAPEDTDGLPAGRQPAGRRTARVEATVAAFGVALLAAQWAGPVSVALRQGMTNGDSLWYHMPFAARFAQEGSTTGLHFLGSEPLTTFYPANGSLLHALGIVALDADVLSPFVNLGWLALALLAGWCAGRAAGAAPATLLGVAVVLAAPVVATTQAGEATSDVAALALVVAAVGLLLSFGARGAGSGLAALAAGLALGVKVSFLAPVGLLAVGAVAAAPRGGRRRAAVVWALGLALGGGYWYARNLLAVGNPLPWFGLSLGPVELPSPPMPLADRYRYTVLHYAGDLDVWREWLLPALPFGFGEGWPIVLGLAAAGAIAAVVRGPAIARAVGAVTIAMAAVYTVTPQSAGGPEGSPGLFLFNLRFLTPALALGLVLLPVVLARRRGGGFAPRRVRVVTGAYALLLALTALGSEPLLSGRKLVPLVAGAAALALAGTLLVRRRPLPRPGPLAAGALAIVLAAAGWPVQSRYLDGRYAERSSALGAVYAWARGVHGSRIAVAGLHQQYPLHGKRVTNHVQYVGLRGPHGAFSPPLTCRAWRSALRSGRYRYVVTAPIDYPVNRAGRAPVEARWTRTDPGARELLSRAGQISVFRLDRPPDPTGCP